MSSKIKFRLSVRFDVISAVGCRRFPVQNFFDVSAFRFHAAIDAGAVIPSAADAAALAALRLMADRITAPISADHYCCHDLILAR